MPDLVTVEGMPLDQPPQPTVLARQQWQAREAAHQQRADALTAGWRARRATGESDEIEDFLFTYYSYRPSLLRRWHPGAGVILQDAAAEPRAAWRWYAGWAADPDRASTDVHVDAAAFLDARASAVGFIETLLRRTLERPARIGCNCLHEWAMVYDMHEGEQRHTRLPLRLGQRGTNEVVEQGTIICSHFDAFRFFTPEARPLNTLQPERAMQADLEQSGCLHANMDLYKWAVKLGPLVPGELLLDTFELAREIRTLDMQASPYDVSDFGLPAVPIETAAGRHEFASRQREFAARADVLRRRLLQTIEWARLATRGQEASTPMAAPTI